MRSHAWLWATLVSAAIAYLLFMGPTEVLLPFVVKNGLGDGAGALGLVFAAGGLGSLLCAVVIGQRGLPRRELSFMYICWTLATLAIAGYGLASQLWGLMLASVAFNASRRRARSPGRRPSSGSCPPSCWGGSPAWTG